MKFIFIKILLFIVVITLSSFAQNNFDIKTKLSNNNYEEERTITITIIKNGGKFYSISKNLSPHYSLPEIIIFENGNLVLLHSLEGTIEFYDPTQRLIVKKENLISKLYDEHKILFSKTSTEIVLLISENNKNKITVFNSFGKQISSTNLDGGIANGIILSNGSNKCAVSLYNWQSNKLLTKSFIIDLTNNKQRQFPVLFNNGFFNKNDSQFCGFTNKDFFQIDLLKNEIILNKKTSKDKILIDVQTYNQNTYFIKTNLPKLKKGIWEYQSAEVIKIDTNNKEKIVEKITFPFKKISFKKVSGSSLSKINSKEFSLEIIR